MSRVEDVITACQYRTGVIIQVLEDDTVWPFDDYNMGLVVHLCENYRSELCPGSNTRYHLVGISELSGQISKPFGLGFSLTFRQPF